MGLSRALDLPKGDGEDRGSVDLGLAERAGLECTAFGLVDWRFQRPMAPTLTASASGSSPRPAP